MLSDERLEVVPENVALTLFAPLNATVRNVANVIEQDETAKVALQRNNNVDVLGRHGAFVVARIEVRAVRIDSQIGESSLILEFPIHYNRTVACGRVSYAGCLYYRRPNRAW
jgi:hypothetical protein